MSPIDPGLGLGSDGSDGDDVDYEDRGRFYAERVYRDRRGYGDHGDPSGEVLGRVPTDIDRVRSKRKTRSDGGGGPSPWAFIAVFAVVVCVAIGAFMFVDRTKSIDIVDGDDAAAVAVKLTEADDKIDPGEAQALLEGPGPAIWPGTYELDDSLNTVDQVRALQSKWVDADPGITFPEGFTVEKIASRIAANRWQYTVDGLVVASEGLTVDPRVQRPADITSTEGLLFPSTYTVGSDFEPSRTMGQMLVTMQEILFDEMGVEQRAQELGITPYELVIVASLIEKEAKTPDDRALISRVIYNRLDREMMLQIDASLYYQAPEDAEWSQLRDADSPYNLYEYAGLPPTPIANPGRASLEAAMNPAPPLDPSDERCAEVADEDCALLFYVLADDEGNHAFAVTNAQHEANIEAAREAGVL